MFPLGIEHYLIGGILVGIGVSLIYILTGLHATQSSFFTTTLSWVSKRKHFQKEHNKQERNWRLFLAIGLVLGALIYTLTLSPTGFWSTSVQLWRLALGGLLVGFGTRLSGGCTSGHGISGLGSLSLTSLSAVIVFMGIAIVTANVVQIIGVLP
ncbi:MAG: YeeE/YedE thiosulfate transporter family protein [Candidatus Bathyarchaeota archaeon]|nr:YeeE/YedE thiosulfate transporter family protein [Candidatus Bathyarchaeota archaeon]MDI9578314.1 YeeE/YedE thiosulfate transporter family protein [Thermoproteota archaeon]MDT8781552.1 YeeE/YedE family protein [Candidatus Bathyarchaeota archaeon]